LAIAEHPHKSFHEKVLIFHEIVNREMQLNITGDFASSYSKIPTENASKN
jgi:hypothetical protein